MSLVRSIDEEEICGYVVSAKMKRIWEAELRMLETLKDICARHGITYYAVAGTLLGAVRHQGFIPWDDDIDVGMPRSEYDRFVSVAEFELKRPYFPQTYRTERRFSFDMIKIRDSSTTGFTPNEALNRVNRGIFLDVFPVDNEPDDVVVRAEEDMRLSRRLRTVDRLSRRVITSRSGVRKLLSEGSRAVACAITPQAMKVRMLDAIALDAARHNREKTEWCGLRTFNQPNQFRWRLKDCESLIDLPFEGTSIAAPAGFDRILTDVYGDWREYVVGSSMHSGTVYDPDTPFEDYKPRG